MAVECFYNFHENSNVIYIVLTIDDDDWRSSAGDAVCKKNSRQAAAFLRALCLLVVVTIITPHLSATQWNKRCNGGRNCMGYSVKLLCNSQ